MSVARYSKRPAPPDELWRNVERIKQQMLRFGLSGNLIAISKYDTHVCAIEEDGDIFKYSFSIFDDRYRREYHMTGYGAPDPKDMWSAYPALIKLSDIEQQEWQTTLF